MIDLTINEPRWNPDLALAMRTLWLDIDKYRDKSKSPPKIAMIKHVRYLTGCGLKEAKDFCEECVFPDKRSEVR